MATESDSSSSRLRWHDPRLLFLFAILLAYVLWPILLVLADSVWNPEAGFTLEPWRQFVARGHGVFALRSVAISLATVALAGVFGTALALLYFRLEFPGRAVFAALSLLPFTLPPLVGVFAIWTLMGIDGPFDRLTRAILPGDGLGFNRGVAGVLLVHAYSMYVYFYVLVGGALASFDESQIEAARDLGASRRVTFFRVVFPQLLPAIAGASLLTFMTSMASFTAPFFYMEGRPVLTVGIQQAWENARWGLASVDCVVLMLCAGLFLFLLLRFEKTIDGGTKGTLRRRIEIRGRLGRGALAVGASCLTLALLAPHLSLLYKSLVKTGTGFFGQPVEYTLANYLALWRREDSWQPIATSLQASSFATVAVILATLVGSWVIVRKEFAGKFLARALIMLPWALPGTVIAIGLLWMTRQPNALTLGMEWRGSIVILVLAYFIRLLPLAHRTVAGGLLRVPVELESAARDLGAGPMQSYLRVTLPLIAPAVVAAATLVFVTAMGEFVSSILLSDVGTEPISVRINQLRRAPGGHQLAAAYSTILMLMITLTFILVGKRSKRNF